MDSFSLINPLRVSVISCENQPRHLWSASPLRTASVFGSRTCSRGVGSYLVGPVKVYAVVPASSSPTTKKIHRVGDFMTEKKHLVVVKPTTPIDEALEKLVKYKISGFPVVDDDSKLIGVITDYDMLANSVSGLAREPDISDVFPEVDSNWKIFNELQKLLCKSAGKTVVDVMTPSPLVIHENMNLEDAARWLLETKHRRLPVVDDAGNLVGIITRGGVLRAAFQNKHLDQSL